LKLLRKFLWWRLMTRMLGLGRQAGRDVALDCPQLQCQRGDDFEARAVTALGPFYSMFPDADELIKMSPGDVARTFLRLALARGKGTPFLPETLYEPSPVDLNAGRYYRNDKKLSVERFLGRVFTGLKITRFGSLAPALTAIEDGGS
jgi:hypothetical protein